MSKKAVDLKYKLKVAHIPIVVSNTIFMKSWEKSDQYIILIINTRETAAFGTPNGLNRRLWCRFSHPPFFCAPISTQMILKLPQGHEGSEIKQREGCFYRRTNTRTDRLTEPPSSALVYRLSPITTNYYSFSN